jgi:hypothetical protein
MELFELPLQTSDPSLESPGILDQIMVRKRKFVIPALQCFNLFTERISRAAEISDRLPETSCHLHPSAHTRPAPQLRGHARYGSLPTGIIYDHICIVESSVAVVPVLSFLADPGEVADAME